MVADNFDATISSQNGLLSTHSLAVLITVKYMSDAHQKETTIRHLIRDEMKTLVAKDIVHYRYKGPKKPEMPVQEAKCAVMPLHVLTRLNTHLARTRELDFLFLRRVNSEQNVSEFAGFNTKLCREDGQSIQPATRAIYMPLIDIDPADSNTMLTAKEEGTTFDTRVWTDCYDLHK